MIRILLLLVSILAPAEAPAQTGSDRVEVEPVTCWWRTSATSVRAGETFGVLLTCALLQTEAARVVADESRLDPAVVQLPPFEVVGGSRAEDLTTATRRFVQLEYRLRVIAENVFASDVVLPPLEIAYRVESRVAGADAVAGRDLTYALPPLTMRVLSLVPDTADDIREAPVASFADVDRAVSRAGMLRAAALVALGLGVLMVGLALAGALRQRRAVRPAARRALPAALVLKSLRRELAGVEAQVRASGWSADLAGSALAAARIVAAYATGRPVSQRPAAAGPAAAPGQPGAGSGPSDGELLVSGMLGPPTVVSSSVATIEDDALADALARFAAARYGREASFDDRLDESLRAVIRRADQLSAERPLRERLWPR